MAGQLKRRCIFGILMLALTCLLIARLDGSRASNVAQEEDKQVLKKGEYPHPVTDLVNVKVKGVPVAFGRQIGGGREWLKGLTVGVKNTSTKPVVYVELELALFGEKGDREATGKRPFVYPLSYGDYNYADPSQPLAPGAPYGAIAPGDSVDIALTDEAYESLTSMLLQNSYPLPPKHAELSVSDVIFADGTRWYKSMLLRRDPNDPKQWLRIWRTGARPGKNSPRPADTENHPGGFNAAFF